MPQFKRDDDVRRFGLVHLQTGLAVVAPAGYIHNHTGKSGRLDRLYDVEPVAVEKERVFAEQVVPAFLKAYLKGEVDRLVVVEHLATAPDSKTASGWLPEFLKDLFRRS